MPVAVKDLCDTKGVRTTAGTRVMGERIAERDATVVARLRDAGAVLLGKLATTEGAYAEHHPDYAVPVNPWNPQAWTGVSSSGSGVATASGLCFAALGTDTGGSIRFPSAQNGVVGIKPTFGRVPVLDAAIVLEAIAGADDGDPTTAVAPVDDYVEAARRGARAGARLGRIGFDPASLEGLDGEICGKFHAALDTYRALGAGVVEVALPPSEDLVSRWAVTCGAEMLVGHEAFFPVRADDYGAALRLFLEAALGMPPAEYARTHQLRMRFCGELARMFEEVDFFASPTVGVRAPAGLSVMDSEVVELMGRLMRFTAPFNYSGSPTISLPCGILADGVPASLQLVGRAFSEAALIETASAYEAAARRR